MLTELFLIRHAEPDRATGLPYAVLPGPPLTLRGEEEAVQAGHWLRERGIERLLSSPFTRASATATTIGQLIGLEPTLVETLREVAPGETHPEVRARIAGLIDQLDDTSLQRVALVTHGSCILAALQHTTNDRIDLSGHRYDYGNHTPTAGIWHGVRTEHGWRWSLAFYPGRATES
ncbi:histidine phosphatase family protein [Roseiflexus sp.]|uniref:histidine phosphatase family protein n=1 Tax=Roseiflexus sp. TaxID=2562120 RepID=UPI0021DE59E2|nr:histidine phosphatase family protein [Roseiflexus sp.]GIW02464.1 MAG: phosphoglycerate mutase [Roseiflexus sp.]